LNIIYVKRKEKAVTSEAELQKTKNKKERREKESLVAQK